MREKHSVSDRVAETGDATMPRGAQPMTTLEWSASSTDRMSWEAAHDWCRALREGGHEDWRLPTIAELFTLVDHTQRDPACALANTQSSIYWSSTTYQDFPDYAWAVGFYGGYVGANYKSNANYVRAVRESDVAALTPRDGNTRALLRDVARSGVTLDDPRIPYVTVQIDRDTWDALRRR